MRILFCVVLLAVLAAFTLGANLLVLPSAEAGDEKDQAPAFKYIGVDGCKFCHQGKRGNHVFESWTRTEHARAYEHLSASQRKNKDCLACHTTGFGQPIAAGATQAKLQGVQCESCHGPGSDYKKMKIMKDRSIAIEKGLIEPTEGLCKRCHTANLPKECRKGADESPAFDYEKAVKEIAH